MDNSFKSPNVISLCTGMRGLERGIERVIGDVNVFAYVEIEAFICENLVQQMEKGLLAPAPIWTNLKTFPARQFHGKVHGLIGGYPCQPFSVAGNQKGTEDPRHLWPYIKEQIRAIGPIWCFFENVPGHINIGYEQVRRDLQEFGYEVKEGIFSAEEVGAPHQRKRLFILAIKLEHAFGGRYGNKKEEICTGRNSLESSNNELADTNHQGSQGRLIRELQECSSELPVGESDTLWPSRPGENQHEWESPRTKPRLGFTVNGYNFREDLLRMAGNTVVEQTAELAFKILLGKHLI